MYVEMGIEKLGKLCSAKTTSSNTLQKIYDEVKNSDIKMLPYIKSLIASNKNVSFSLLSTLKDDTDLLVRAAAIDNENAPKEWKTQGGNRLDQSVHLTGFQDIFGD